MFNYFKTTTIFTMIFAFLLYNEVKNNKKEERKMSEKTKKESNSLKQELIDCVKELKIEGLSEKKIKDILAAIKKKFVDKIRKREDFNIVGVAGVRIKKLKARQGMIIFGNDNEKINLPERYAVRVKISEVLKEIVRGKR